MKPLILASSSPRRREILTLTGLPFEVLTPSVEEGEIPLTDPDIYVEELSLIKCRAGLREAAEAHTQALVIGADTIVCHNGHILGKPLDEEDAFDMLRQLSGDTHYVFTGVTVGDLASGQTETFHEKTEVIFYDLSDQEILDYIRTGEPLDKAGSYGIQGRGACLVRMIRGDYYNVVGLPVGHLMQVLKHHE